jgi:uncharacterized membrane protein
MNKTPKLIFLASIVLNVLFIGVFAGQLPRRLDEPVTRKQRMEILIEKLPEGVQARFRKNMKDAEPIRNQLRDARNEALDILAAEGFDEDAYDRQVAQINELRVRLAKKMAADIKAIAKILPPDERKALAEAFRRRSAQRG